MIIPFDAGDFTSLTTDAGGHINELADFRFASRAVTGGSAEVT
jgi:hypothetical protein